MKLIQAVLSFQTDSSVDVYSFAFKFILQLPDLLFRFEELSVIVGVHRIAQVHAFQAEFAQALRLGRGSFRYPLLARPSAGAAYFGNADLACGRVVEVVCGRVFGVGFAVPIKGRP